MTFIRVLSLSTMALTIFLGANAVDAQRLSKAGGPAEIPPASFKSNQYVDSKGCVFIRAGVDGNVTWVPRVSRSRQVVCGRAPTNAGGATAVAAAKAPVVISPGTRAAPKSPAQTSTIAAALSKKPVRTVASKRAKPVVRKAAPVRRAAPVAVQPRPVAAQPRVVQAPRVVRQANGAARCQGASSVSQRYVATSSEYQVRCGPQAESPVTTAGQVRGGTFRSADGSVLTNVSPNARVVPRHVYEQQQAARINTPTPKGYRQVWKDDRLNPNRTNQTLAGKAQMDLVWTRTVPRQLVVRQTGQVVTRSYPGLQYPYTSMAQQNAAVRQGVRVSTKSAPQRVVRKKTVQQTRAAVPTQRRVAAVASKRFVQVGTFSVASNAQNTANRLQRMGLPVRIGKFVRGGKQMRIVLAGPFASPAHTNGALSAVRRAGFRDAYARN